VNVRTQPDVAVGALDHGNRAVHAVGDAQLRKALVVVGRHGVDEDAHDLGESSPIEGRVVDPVQS
jgi:hypothetical protein